MVGFTILGIAAILTAVGAKSTYYILKVLAGISWIGLGVFWIYAPFTTAGTPPHEIILSVVFIAGVSCFFWAFWTDKLSKSGQPTGNGRFRLPFMPTDDEDESLNERAAPTLRERNSIYQQKLDAASRGERRGR